MSIYTINSETDVSTLATGDVFVVYDASASNIKKATVAEMITAMSLATTPLAGGVVNITASVGTITAATHANRVVTLNRAAGTTITLPAASGTGNKYTFFVGTTFTANGVIQVANTTDVISGNVYVTTTTSTNAEAFATSATSDTITLDGTTTGGILGDRVEIIDVASGRFSVVANTSATGTEATPFSAAV